MMPSTDLIDFGGIPYRRVGAETYDARGGVELRARARDTIASSLDYQDVAFQQSEAFRDFLRGGHILESLTAYRHSLSPRLNAGVDYSFRRASVLGDSEQFNISTVEAAAGYELSPAWSMSAGAGVVHLQAQRALGRRAAARRCAWRSIGTRRGAPFHVGYLRSYIPAFGFGGTVQNQEVGVGFRTPLFHSRRFYTDQSLVFRDDTPLDGRRSTQLPLRSLRTVLDRRVGAAGMGPLRSVLCARAAVDAAGRRRLSIATVSGFQIVTSKPMRMQ